MLLRAAAVRRGPASFSGGPTPAEAGVCASPGRHGDAARVLSETGHPVVAALELEAPGRARRRAWSGSACRRRAPRPAAPTRPRWPTSTRRGAAAHRRSPVRPAPLGIGARMLESAADDFETRGEPVRAFDCYRVLLRLGKATGSFEKVAEGSLNASASPTEDRRAAMQYYDDFLAYASSRRSGTPPPWRPARRPSTASGWASRRTGTTWSVAAEPWTRAARANQPTTGPSFVRQRAPVRD